MTNTSDQQFYEDLSNKISQECDNIRSDISHSVSFTDLRRDTDCEHIAYIFRDNLQGFDIAYKYVSNHDTYQCSIQLLPISNHLLDH